ncbi:hypothetical protein [Paraburkholderia sp. BL17N1]|uniref:hypothetical protein n=1 Tax=Paraburkholderia sp. BL17N1 TaxID=1938798 RepID=UPI000EAE90F4|nr:hypothetical protein [Paraburkholderia sp. BL17N1]RKR46319.1 hypothetical protein B0G82_4002 [Paraburkholderia sp. BL17N1]
MDVYSIGTTLKLHDLITPQLLKLSEGFAKIDAIALQVNKRLQKMGTEVVGVRNLSAATKALDGSLKSVNAEALNAGRALHGIKAAMPPGSLGIEKELVAANTQVNILGRQLHALRGVGHNFMGGGAGGFPAALPGGGGGGGRHRGGLHGGNLHFGAHGVGVGGVGMGLASDMLVPLAAAGVAVYVGHKFYEAGKDYEMAFNRFKTLNLGAKVNEDADKFARGTQQFGISMTERMTMLRDMHEVMGNYEEAKAITPLFARMLAANKGVFGEEGNRFDNKTFQALGKVIEMRGGTNSESEMFKQADFAQKVLTGSAGLVTPTDLLAFMKTGGVATRLLSNKAFYEESAPMIQEMGGSRYGTALMSAHQNLAMGRGTVQAMKEAVRLGIIDSKMVEYTKIGTLKRVLPGALKDSQLYDTSKFEYLLKVLVPAIRQAGVVGPGKKLVTGDAITDEMMVNELNTIFSQRTASNAFAQMYLQRHKIDKNVAVTEGAMGLKDLEDQYKKSPAGAEAEFTAAWTDFKTEFGRTMLPAITKMLLTGASILRAINSISSSPMTVAQAQIDQVPQSDHPTVGRWGKLGDMFGWNKPTDQSHTSTSVSGGSSSPSGNVHTSVHLDGRKIADAVSPYFAGPLGSGLHIGGIDSSLSLPMPSLK